MVGFIQNRWIMGAAAAAVVAGTAVAVAQPKPAGITVQIALQVAGAAYTASGPGECIYSDDSSIFEAPASQWGVRHDDGNRDLNFTLWRLKKGSEGVTLFVTVGGKTHRVNTLAVGPPTNKRGSGTATFQKRAAGGTFTIDAVADTGAKITGTLTCSGFAKPEDNGN